MQLGPGSLSDLLVSMTGDENAPSRCHFLVAGTLFIVYEFPFPQTQTAFKILRFVGKIPGQWASVSTCVRKKNVGEILFPNSSETWNSRGL